MVLILTGGVLEERERTGGKVPWRQFLEILECSFLIGKWFPISSTSATVEALVK